MKTFTLYFSHPLTLIFSVPLFFLLDFFYASYMLNLPTPQGFVQVL